MIKYAVVEILMNYTEDYPYIDVDCIFDNLEDAMEHRTRMLAVFADNLDTEDVTIFPFNYQVLQYMDAE